MASEQVAERPENEGIRYLPTMFPILTLTRVGMWMYENFSGGVQGLSMALFTRGLGWSAEEVEAFLVDVRKDMKDTKIHGYYVM